MEIKINYTCKMHVTVPTTVLKSRCYYYFCYIILLSSRVVSESYFLISDDKHGYYSEGNLT